MKCSIRKEGFFSALQVFQTSSMLQTVSHSIVMITLEAILTLNSEVKIKYFSCLLTCTVNKPWAAFRLYLFHLRKRKENMGIPLTHYDFALVRFHDFLNLIILMKLKNSAIICITSGEKMTVIMLNLI